MFWKLLFHSDRNVSSVLCSTRVFLTGYIGSTRV